MAEMRKDDGGIVPYNSRGIPLLSNRGRLSALPKARTMGHWHPDVELVHMIDGRMRYFVDDRAVELGPGDSLFVNARSIHRCAACEDCDAEFSQVVFHPDLLTGNAAVRDAFIAPLIDRVSVPYLHLEADTEAGGEVGGRIEEIVSLQEARPVGCELGTIGLLHMVMGVLFRQPRPAGTGAAPTAGGGRDRRAMQLMIDYIHGHFAEKVKLEEIARAGQVSRSKCGQVFQDYLGQSPIEYLNSYRLDRARGLLLEGGTSIAETAARSGFSHQSYFSKLFSAEFDQTPKQFQLANA